MGVAALLEEISILTWQETWTGLELQDFPLHGVLLIFEKFIKVNKENRKRRYSKSIQPKATAALFSFQL